ncbi:NAD(P)-dependent oxidoreductase [Magnetovibrio sp.]|uniref:NAD-dependent epimerase/dehydratase family protein n=1 Tax=Magnetovibrio sp. TaxID=2024836 RepID=UPI002F95795E
MTRVLVTGATGLIGKHAIAALVARGLEVHGVARARPASSPPGVIWHNCDLLTPGAVERLAEEVKATHLLHLAWVTEHGQFWNAPQNHDWQLASQRLVEAFRSQGGTRVVMAGSCAEYDWTRLGDGVCRENETPLKPHTLYGQSKLEFSRWLAAYAAETGLSQAWGRVFLLYGVGENENRLVPSIVLALNAGREAKCSSGVQVRDFMSARDVGWGFSALLMSDVEGAVNVATGEPHTIAEVATTLGEFSGHPELVRLGAFADRPDDPPVLVADATRLRDEVGFSPAMGFRNALKQAYDQIRNGAD